MNTNKRIASGLPGFGSKGPKGVDGFNGLSVYFTDLDGILDKRVISDRIKNNLSLISANGSDYNMKEYIKGDSFIDINSNVYEITMSPSIPFVPLGYKYVPNDIFEKSGYKNSYGYEKYTNSYIGNNKFLIDDIQSDTFTPNIYNSMIFGHNIGEFNKVNYSDKHSNKHYLHEAYVNSTSLNNSLGIISVVDNNNSTSIFRIGNTSSIKDEGGKLVYTPSNIAIKFDASNLFIPENTYITDSSGNEYKVLSYKDYDMGVFKYFKEDNINENVINASIEKKTSESDSKYKVKISKFSFLDAFENLPSSMINSIRANIILYNDVTTSSVYTIDNQNTYTLYDIKNDSSDIVIDDIVGNNWKLKIELIDENTGWSRYSNQISLSESKIFLYARLVNSTLYNKTFNISIIANGGVVYNNNFSLEPTSYIDQPIPLDIHDVTNDTLVDIVCRDVFTDKSVKILYNNTTNPTYGQLKLDNNMLFHLGYNISDVNFEYNKDNYNFLSTIEQGEYNTLLNEPSIYEVTNVGFYNNVLSFMEIYSTPQTFIHTKKLRVKLFNNSSFEFTSPSSILYKSSSDNTILPKNMSSLSIAYKPSNHNENLDLFGISDYEYELEIPINERYIYIFVSNLSTIEYNINGCNISLNYTDTCKGFYDQDVDRACYMIDNPYYNNDSNEVYLKYITLKDKQDAYILYAARDSWNVNNRVVLSISDNIHISPFGVGFNNKIINGKGYINNSRPFYEFKGVRGEHNIQSCNYGFMDLEYSQTSHINTSIFSFKGTKDSIRVDTPRPIYEYNNRYFSFNHDTIIQKFFEAISKTDFRNLVGFNQKLFRPIKTYWWKKPGTLFLNQFNDNIEIQGSIIDTNKYFEANTIVTFYADSKTGKVDNYILPSKNTFNEDVDLHNNIINLNYTNNIEFSGSYQDFEPTNVYINAEKIQVYQPYTLVSIYRDFIYQYKLDNGEIVNGVLQIDSFDGVRLFDLYQHNNYSNPLIMEYNGPIDIGNNGENKNEFTFRVQLRVKVSQSWGIVLPFGYGNDKLISLAKYSVGFLPSKSTVSISNYGKNTDGTNTNFIDVKNDEMILKYLHNQL